MINRIVFITVLKAKHKHDRVVVDTNSQDLVFRVSDLLNGDKDLKACDYIAEIDLKTKIVKYHAYESLMI